MFGNKLRSWMEAVRSKKKQHRKDKHSKATHVSISTPPENSSKAQTTLSNRVSYTNIKGNEIIKDSNHLQSNVANCNSHHSRYSANNLSSPESAYSTGYSTDGTSPGAGIPPDYLNNMQQKIQNKEVHFYANYGKVPLPSVSPNTKRLEQPGTNNSANGQQIIAKLTPVPIERRTPILNMKHEPDDGRLSANNNRAAAAALLRAGNASPALGVTSPRQRNRIRTNPWLPGGAALSPALTARHDFPKTSIISANRTPILDSPRPRGFLSPSVRRRSLSSSSCSSLSGASLNWGPANKHRSIKSISDEDDCTLNEMMGKYDESYVYEKETDILSDSDPTDCETDIDTGQDGGDEDDPLEVELDFIDNGSFLDYEPKLDQNTGHCSYYAIDIQRKSSRRRTRRSKQASEKRRRSSSNKKRHKERSSVPLDGSKSAGATPVSVRRANQRPISKLALEDCLKKRSNSVNLYREPHVSTIDKRDKEADLKYKELIGEAEQILRTMKCNGLSPRRVPGPANKRVELLRTTECAKPELYIKNRNDLPDYPKIPSTNYSNYSPRFSPKKNHITNFIINNSPILVRREWEQAHNQPAVSSWKKVDDDFEEDRKPKSILVSSKRSPKYRKKVVKQIRNSSSSDSDDGNLKERRNNCPQSEPVRRKAYFGHSPAQVVPSQGKTIAFNLSNIEKGGKTANSTENLRQQVLLNTIANLKKNLEDQSASLKQVYRSSHNIHI